ncbi:MAG: ketoacyl-ACP synthase III [Bacteroidota bacterium]
MQQNAMIVACGAYAPERIITNQWFNDLLGEDVDTWLRENVHIQERRWSAENESSADLAEKAALQCLQRANLTADQLDLIIVSTDTPEYISPATASVLQHRLGAGKAGIFDINAACAGFVTALDIGSKYIRADQQYQNVLIIGTYAMSKYLNLADKKTVTLFADGAGAFLLQATADADQGFLASELIAEGQYHDHMGIYAGGTKTPVNEAAISRHEHQLQFVHRFPKELNPTTWSAMAKRLNERLDVTPAEVNRYFITQININAIWETLDLLGVERETGHTIMHHYGYTGSACIPMAFNDAWEKKLVQTGDLVYFIGSGGGLAFASAAFRL